MLHSGSPVSQKKELSEWKIGNGLLSYYESILRCYALPVKASNPAKNDGI
jgi:hypothetical protein